MSRKVFLAILFGCSCLISCSSAPPDVRTNTPLTVNKSSKESEIEKAVREFFAQENIKVVGIDAQQDKEFDSFYLVVADVLMPDGKKTEKIVNCQEFYADGKTYWKVTPKN